MFADSSRTVLTQAVVLVALGARPAQDILSAELTARIDLLPIVT